MGRNKQRFSYTNNALSKRGYLQGLFQILTFRSKGSLRKVVYSLSRFFGVKENQIFLFAAGRMSVYNLIKSLKLKESDEVIVAGYTCVVLTNAVKFTGCKIRYVDINLSTLNMDTDQLIQSLSTQTKLLIVPHNFGLPFEDIEHVKSRFPKLIILEDVAHSFGSSSIDNKLCGTIGDAGFFSLEYSKPLTSGLGGILVINNKELLPAFNEEYEKLQTLSGSIVFKMLLTLGVYNLFYFRKSPSIQSKATSALRRMKLLYRTSRKEIEGEIPENYPVKLSPTLACFLLPQLKRIENINDKKRTIVKIYRDTFEEFLSIEKIGREQHVLARYPILFKENVALNTINNIRKEAKMKGLNFGEWFNDVVHPIGSFRYGYTEGICPNGEFVAKRILNLPVNAFYPALNEDILEIKAIFKKHGIN